MAITRRSIVQASLVTAAALGTQAGVANQEATPATEALPVEEVLRLLRETTPASPLFPSDTGTLEVVDWVDDSDTDLAGTVGAVLVQDTSRGEGDEAFIGAYIVHPKVTQAEERLRDQTSDGGEDSAVTLFGHTAANGQFPDGFSLIAVVQGFVIVSAIGMPVEPLGPDEPGSTRFAETGPRALGHLAGLLDHLRLLTAE